MDQPEDQFFCLYTSWTETNGLLWFGQFGFFIVINWTTYHLRTFNKSTMKYNYRNLKNTLLGQFGQFGLYIYRSF